jgi:hypothetical protein
MVKEMGGRDWFSLRTPRIGDVDWARIGELAGGVRNFVVSALSLKASRGK